MQDASWQAHVSPALRTSHFDPEEQAVMTPRTRLTVLNGKEVPAVSSVMVSDVDAVFYIGHSSSGDPCQQAW